METVINEYISQELVRDPALLPLADEAPLLDSGILDSLSLLRLVIFVEERFGVTMGDDTDMLPKLRQREHDLRLPARPGGRKAAGRTWVTAARGGCSAA